MREKEAERRRKEQKRAEKQRAREEKERRKERTAEQAEAEQRRAREDAYAAQMSGAAFSGSYQDGSANSKDLGSRMAGIGSADLPPGPGSLGGSTSLQGFGGGMAGGGGKFQAPEIRTTSTATQRADPEACAGGGCARAARTIGAGGRQSRAAAVASLARLTAG